jgi:hypothetical protein
MEPLRSPWSVTARLAPFGPSRRVRFPHLGLRGLNRVQCRSPLPIGQPAPRRLLLAQRLEPMGTGLHQRLLPALPLTLQVERQARGTLQLVRQQAVVCQGQRSPSWSDGCARPGAPGVHGPALGIQRVHLGPLTLACLHQPVSVPAGEFELGMQGAKAKLAQSQPRFQLP